MSKFAKIDVHSGDSLLFQEACGLIFVLFEKKDGGVKVDKKADRQLLLQLDAGEEFDREKVAAVAELP